MWWPSECVSARVTYNGAMRTLSELSHARRSVRAFLPQEVPAQTLRGALEIAQRAPSWCNIQPWRVWIASGAARDALVAGYTEAALSRMPTPDVPFPGEYPEPYAQHRRDCGRALYEAMGVARHDGPGRQAAWMRNFVAFDAPHVAIVAIDRRFGLYAALDVGCWLEALLLALEEAGVSACGQAALATYPDVPRRVLGIGEDVSILFGIAIGYEDASAAANACRTTRQPIEANVTFVGE